MELTEVEGVEEVNEGNYSQGLESESREGGEGSAVEDMKAVKKKWTVKKEKQK